MIANHAAATLSELDLRIADAVPPGGNWKDIPVDVPSERLAQIRTSFAAGEGSRSTYYGRLRPDRPAYTINTYYNRPGNGCFLHHDKKQNRTISHREAARLQSFPDSFVFTGSQRAVCQQIGNAVPPLLALQIAQALGRTGTMVDIFAGAGGLSRGFEWAGWRSACAVDSDVNAVTTFNKNLEDVAFAADLNDESAHDRILQAVASRGTRKLALVGGPPCQGFSTGGKRRSSSDVRNQLYRKYIQLLQRSKPDVFVFENVTGLLNLEAGGFLRNLLGEFEKSGYATTLWKLNAAQYGVPQRRNRVIIVGAPSGTKLPTQPQPWTDVTENGLLGVRQVCTVAEALDDLPRLKAGEDGSARDYRIQAQNSYQRFMRGELSALEYLEFAKVGDGRDHRSSRVRRVASGA